MNLTGGVCRGGGFWNRLNLNTGTVTTDQSLVWKRSLRPPLGVAAKVSIKLSPCHQQGFQRDLQNSPDRIGLLLPTQGVSNRKMFQLSRVSDK